MVLFSAGTVELRLLRVLPFGFASVDTVFHLIAQNKQIKAIMKRLAPVPFEAGQTRRFVKRKETLVWTA